MNWDLGCGNASELARQADVLEQTSVIHFSFSMTIMLTILFMIMYSQMLSNKSIIQFMLVSSFVFYVLNVIRLAFFPLPINEAYIELLKQEVDCGVIIERRHNLELFDFMKWDNLFHITTIGNFLMLIPLSFYCPILFNSRGWGLIRMILTGFFVSLTIELTQLSYDLLTGYAYRGFNVDDLMMNTLGVIFGFIIFSMGKAIIFMMMKFIGFVYKKAR
ncbi:MAG: VanZ family protein [Turicibacter sp.]|nr:VanZ family protein [Turicibacter sp.]